MIVGRAATRFGSGVACAALSLSLAVSGAGAQTYGPANGSGSPAAQTTSQAPAGSQAGGPFVVRVEEGIPVSGVAGNMTLRGVAVDCGTGRAATRVALLDGENGPYVADVSMDTNKTIATYCPGMSGVAQIGFTLIYDTRRLGNGRHSFVLAAEFPGGAKANGTAAVYVDNNTFSVDNSQYNYYDYDPYYYGGYGYGGYGLGGYGYGGYGLGSGLYYGYGGSNTYGGLSLYPYQRSPYTGYGRYSYPQYGSYYGGYSLPYGGFNRYVYPYANYGYYNTYPQYVYPPYYNQYIPPFINPIQPGYPGFSIILYQAGLTVPRNATAGLSGLVSCSLPGTSTVSVYDVTAGGRVLIATVGTSSTFDVVWNTTALTGGRLIQVAAAGPCGAASQTFSVTVV